MNPIHPTVVWLTLRQLFSGKRALVVWILAFAPTLIALVYRATTMDAGFGDTFLASLSEDVILGVVLPLAAVLFGTAAFGGEVDDGTLIYLLVKPIARGRVVLSKYVVAVVATALVMVPAVVLPWLIARTPTLGFRFAVGYLAGAAVGAVIYAALFLAIGLATRRSLVFALVYVIGFERIFTRSVIGAKSLSIREFATTVSYTVGKLVGEPPAVSMTNVYVMGSLILVAALFKSLRQLQGYEVAEQP